MLGVAAAAGVAFTVSLFVTDLAFGDRPELVLLAKMGILACAPIAGLLGYVLLRMSTDEHSSDCRLVAAAVQPIWKTPVSRYAA